MKSASSILDFVEILAGFLKNLQEKLHSLEQQTSEDKAPKAEIQKGMNKLKSEVVKINEMVNQRLVKIETFVDEANAHYIRSRALEVIGKIIESNASIFSKSDYYETILKILVEEVHSNKGLLLAFADEGEEAEILAQYGFSSSDILSDECLLSRTLINELKTEKNILRVDNASKDPKYSQETSIINMKARSVILAPLFFANDLVGCIYLGSHDIKNIYTAKDETLLSALSSILSSLLVNPITYLKRIELIPEPLNEELPSGIIAANPKFKKVLEVARQVAHSQATILIEGETGTGKELVARYVHMLSGRKDKRFVAIDCGALPENLIESELFGYKKGAFTGATEDRQGLFEAANGGTIFLDEISNAPKPLQVKLLRVIEEKETRRIGENISRKVDVRIIAASNRDLKKLVEQGEFREDLYFRLNVVRLVLPPLRERKEDMILLTSYFLSKFSQKHGKRLRIDPDIYLVLEDYSFPGNVRELENLIERMVLLCEGDYIGIEHLPQEAVQLKKKVIALDKNPLSKFLKSAPEDLNHLSAIKSGIYKIAEEYKEKVEQRFYHKILQEAGGNISEAARRSGMDKSDLHKKLKKLKLI